MDCKLLGRLREKDPAVPLLQKTEYLKPILWSNS